MNTTLTTRVPSAFENWVKLVLGALYYLVKTKTPNRAYQSLVALFCTTGGASNDLLSLNVLMTSGVHCFDQWPEQFIRDQDRIAAEDPAIIDGLSRRIDIGDDCWLGMNSVVMPGVSVGRGCVVGSNSVVTRDIPPYSVVAGSPAKLIRKRLSFIPPKLLNWQEPAHLPYFYSGFEISGKERVRNQALGGFVARRRCALWLEFSSMSEIQLRAKSISSAEVVIKCGGVTEFFGPDWKDCRFPVNASHGPIWFEISEGAFVVSEASVV